MQDRNAHYSVAHTRSYGATHRNAAARRGHPVSSDTLQVPKWLSILALASISLLVLLMAAWWVKNSVGSLRQAELVDSGRVSYASPPEFHGSRQLVVQDSEPPVRPIEDLDQEITELGMLAPQAFDRIQGAYLQSTDLYGLLMDLLPLAVRGDGAAQYHMYLALDECRAYLGPNGHATLEQTTLKPFWLNIDSQEGVGGISDTERELWLQEYGRCKSFVEASLVELETALGDDIPGAVSEYAAAWFERAFRTSYPLALIDMAQRVASIDDRSRTQLLQEAVVSGDPQIYLILFEQTWEAAQSGEELANAVAWLLVACNTGLDCSADAYWYRTRACTVNGLAASDCRPRESAVTHFWRALTSEQRLAAYAAGTHIMDLLATGELDSLPWPAGLASLPQPK